MSETIAVTTLVENSVHTRGLLAEHGLAFHLQVGPRSLLLDIQGLAPAHCTGLPALAQLWSAFPGRCFSCAVGESSVFQR
jgi:metal-dependent hydrolase (beta-lactamase superfamily II)